MKWFANRVHRAARPRYTNRTRQKILWFPSWVALIMGFLFESLGPRDLWLIAIMAGTHVLVVNTLHDAIDGLPDSSLFDHFVEFHRMFTLWLALFWIGLHNLHYFFLAERFENRWWQDYSGLLVDVFCALVLILLARRVAGRIGD